MKSEENKDKSKIRRVRKKRTTSPEVRKKISDSMKKYWENVTYIDEQGNVIERNNNTQEDKK